MVLSLVHAWNAMLIAVTPVNNSNSGNFTIDVF